ncbi:methyltransferase [uncultured Aquimarina sp.]|uniref:methyltransferase n=1 Tax=uncultured Aquimarina sp. TaxID=575652 RepID=UPI00260CB868|nr:methyltransferase [uncultured Aquimarina sp.]
MRLFLKKITHPFLKLGLKLFYLKPRKYSYDGIKVLVHPEVFPPHLTLSTKILLDFINPMNLENKTLLELGCGSGIISLYASKKQAIVTATDINKIALQYLEKASLKNNLDLEIIQSDLFDNLQNRIYDYIIINPPYYPRTPKNTKEKAWFCGENFEYFEKLFKQIPNHITNSSNVFMILSNDCDIEHIKSITSKFDLNLKIFFEKKILGEINYIFKIASK